MIKKIFITLLAVTTLAAVLVGCHVNKPEVTTVVTETKTVTEPEIITESENTTEAENTTDAETTVEPESTTEAEPATEKETTPKKIEVTTKKIENPVTERSTEEQQTYKPPETKEFVETNPDVNVLGGKISKIRAGLVYDSEGNLSSYDKIEEGEDYYEYSSGGVRQLKQKPYAAGNEPVILTDYCTFCGAKIDAENALATKTCKHCSADLTKYGVHRCEYCGKSTDDVNGHYACAYGGCLRFLCNGGNCPECGVFVPSGICHTCVR